MDLERVADAAVARFQDSVTLANERLDGYSAQDAQTTKLTSQLAWMARMLVGTAEDALEATAAAARAREQAAADRLRRADAGLADAQRVAAQALVERDELQERLAESAARLRKDGVTATKRKVKDATRAMGLDEQVLQLQAQLKLRESQFEEARRSGQAASRQRERNLQAAIRRMQLDLNEAREAAPPAAAALMPPDTPPAGELMPPAAPQGPTGSAAEALAAGAAEAAELRAEVAELQDRCQRGMALIERLKGRLQQQEKDKGAVSKRHAEALARCAAQQALLAQQGAQLKELQAGEAARRREAEQAAQVAQASAGALKQAQQQTALVSAALRSAQAKHAVDLAARSEPQTPQYRAARARGCLTPGTT